MLASILIWLYAGVLSLIFGFFCIHLIRRLFSLDERSVNSISLPILIILGLVVLTTVASIFSLWIKIGLAANLLFFFGALAIVSLQRKNLIGYLIAEFQALKKINPLIWVFMAVIFLVV